MRSPPADQDAARRRAAHQPGGLDALVGRARARWDALAAERPDLEPAIGLQRTLVGESFDLMRALAGADPPAAPVPPGDLSERLARGVPALRGALMPVPVMAPRLQAFSTHIERGGGGEAARHLTDALATGRIDAGALLAASIGRDQCAIRMAALQLGLSPDLVWLVAELAVGPFAAAWQQRLLEADGNLTGAPTRATLNAAWARGYCPACGSWPVYAEVVDGRRTLRCSLCAASWRPPSAGCVYCHAGSDRMMPVTPDPSRSDRRIECCSSCGGYLKVIELPDATPFPLHTIEDLATADLDVVAMERGFTRPPLPEVEG